MKKIIFLFLMFSTIVFAKWEVGASYTVGGDPLTTFTTYDLEEKGASIVVGVNVNYDYSVVTIRINDKIKKDDDLVLIVTDNEDNDINCTFHSDDIRDYRITVPSNRASVLTKMLYNGKSATLKINGEVYDTFDLRGIKQVMQKHVGSSYWYKYKLND